MKNTMILVMFVVLNIGCKVSSVPTHLTINNFFDPPGTIKISENLYIDQIEITNIGWLEFLAWTSKIYGKESNEYKSMLPDTNVWSKLHPRYTFLDTFYFRHDAYEEFPLVGVTFEQAMAYSNWRSDRVMEAILIMKGIIPARIIVPKDSIFTIKNYFNGQYYGIQPSPKILIYPYYSLPDTNFYTFISMIADSINLANYKVNYKKPNPTFLLFNQNCFDNKPYKSSKLPYGPDPTMSNHCLDCKKHFIAQLNGNVREMTNIKGIVFGNSFLDSCKTSLNIRSYDTLQLNAYTGFRNICTYKPWTNE
ncbi:MAG: SUMF1/EgtB/PvdO family nonheme iron enzyme [Saprospiraceae bacterium]